MPVDSVALVSENSPESVTVLVQDDNLSQADVTEEEPPSGMKEAARKRLEKVGSRLSSSMSAFMAKAKESNVAQGFANSRFAKPLSTFATKAKDYSESPEAKRVREATRTWFRLEAARLHTEMIGLGFWRALFGEFLGTLLLVIIGCGAASLEVIHLSDHAVVAHKNSSVVASQQTGAHQLPFNIRVSLAFGLTYAAALFCLHRGNDGHLNPGVSLAMAATNRIGVFRGLIYMGAQILGALLGAWVLSHVTSDEFGSSLGCTVLAEGVTDIEGFIVEFIASFFLAFVVLSCYGSSPQAGGGSRNRVSSQNSVEMAKPYIIGLALMGGSMFAVPYTSGSLNTARSFGPAFIRNIWTDQWVYWFGPILGGIAGGLFQEMIFGKSTTFRKIQGCCLRRFKLSPAASVYDINDTVSIRSRFNSTDELSRDTYPPLKTATQCPNCRIHIASEKSYGGSDNGGRSKVMSPRSLNSGRNTPVTSHEQHKLTSSAQDDKKHELTSSAQGDKKHEMTSSAKGDKTHEVTSQSADGSEKPKPSTSLEARIIKIANGEDDGISFDEREDVDEEEYGIEDDDDDSEFDDEDESGETSPAVLVVKKVNGDSDDCPVKPNRVVTFNLDNVNLKRSASYKKSVGTNTALTMMDTFAIEKERGGGSGEGAFRPITTEALVTHPPPSSPPTPSHKSHLYPQYASSQHTELYAEQKLPPYTVEDLKAEEERRKAAEKKKQEAQAAAAAAAAAAGGASGGGERMTAIERAMAKQTLIGPDSPDKSPVSPRRLEAQRSSTDFPAEHEVSPGAQSKAHEPPAARVIDELKDTLHVKEREEDQHGHKSSREDKRLDHGQDHRQHSTDEAHDGQTAGPAAESRDRHVTAGPAAGSRDEQAAARPKEYRRTADSAEETVPPDHKRDVVASIESRPPGSAKSPATGSSSGRDAFRSSSSKGQTKEPYFRYPDEKPASPKDLYLGHGSRETGYPRLSPTSPRDLGAGPSKFSPTSPRDRQAPQTNLSVTTPKDHGSPSKPKIHSPIILQPTDGSSAPVTSAVMQSAFFSPITSPKREQASKTSANSLKPTHEPPSSLKPTQEPSRESSVSPIFNPTERFFATALAPLNSGNIEIRSRALTPGRYGSEKKHLEEEPPGAQAGKSPDPHGHEEHAEEEPGSFVRNPTDILLHPVGRVAKEKEKVEPLEIDVDDIEGRVEDLSDGEYSPMGMIESDDDDSSD